MGVSDSRRFGAAGRAVWPIGRAGAAAPSGWIVGLELTGPPRSNDAASACNFGLLWGAFKRVRPAAERGSIKIKHFWPK
eukprot:223523-Alexandrium_andersonii.AAC.1